MYKINFGLMQHHGYSLQELEEMLPWERSIYVSLLTQYLKEQADLRKQQQASRR